MERTNAKLEQELGRRASISEITSALGVDLDSYHKLMNKIKSTSLLSVEEMVYATPGHLSRERSETPAEQSESMIAKMGMENTKQKLLGDIELLPFNQQLILNLYYYDNLSLKEIAKIINLSESRVSQLHTKSINTLKGLHNKRKLKKKDNLIPKTIRVSFPVKHKKKGNYFEKKRAKNRLSFKIPT